MQLFARSLLVAISVIVVGSVMWFAWQQGAASAAVQLTFNARCRPIQGTIHSVFVSQNCTSPVGLCTAGTITGAGPLDGATAFLALSVAPSAGLAGIEPPANLSYSGELTVTASGGTLITRDLGVLDAAHLAFTEMERPESGTGVFANPGSSVFFISGSIVDNGNGFQGNLSGSICANDN